MNAARQSPRNTAPHPSAGVGLPPGPPLPSLPLQRLKPSLPTQTVLLAEDNDDLRELMTYFLISKALRVVACSDAESAIAAFRSQPAVDLLLTDFQMPGQSGVDLARELTAQQPALPVLILSGSVLATDLLREIKDRSWIFLSKPCPFQTLADTLHNLLQKQHHRAA